MTEIKATLFSKTGEKTNFVYNCADVDGKPSLKEIHKSSVQLQQELNKFLTTLVEEEKSKTGKQSKENNVYVDDLEDDDEDEDEIAPPDEKRQKT